MKKITLIALITVLCNTLFGQVTAYQQIGTSAYNYYVTNSFRAGVSLITLGTVAIPNTTSSTVGVVYKNGVRFISAYKPAGTNENLFIGPASGNFTLAATSNFNGNVGLGQNSLQALTTGYFNTATGGYAGEDLTTGHSNTFNGIQAGRNISTGNSNTAFGDAALFGGTANATTATENTAIGALTLNLITTGARNTSLGKSALEIITTGSNNIGIGYQAGNNITTGSNNTVIGYDIDAPSPTGSNQIVIGNANITYLLPPSAVAGGVWTDVAGNGVLTSVVPSGGTPSLTSTQIAFGDGSNLMTSSAGLIYNDGNEFKALINGEGFRTDGSLVYIGDIGIFQDGSMITVNPLTGVAYSDNTSHNIKFGINTATPSVVGITVVGDILGGINGTYSDGLLKTDVANGITYLGDYTEVVNRTWVSVDDNAGQVNLTAKTGNKTILVSGNLKVSGATSVVQLPAYTVATLPAGNTGDYAYVTDALLPTYLGTIVGGGAVVTPVFYDGSNWIAH